MEQQQNPKFDIDDTRKRLETALAKQIEKATSNKNTDVATRLNAAVLPAFQCAMLAEINRGDVSADVLYDAAVSVLAACAGNLARNTTDCDSAEAFITVMVDIGFAISSLGPPIWERIETGKGAEIIVSNAVSKQ